MQKVSTCLWFDKDAEEAIQFYVSVFNDSPFKKTESKIVKIDHWADKLPKGPTEGLEGKVATGIFELEGRQLIAFDGGPFFKFNEASSQWIDCDTQEEVDYFWEKLSAVPEAEQCGWVKDKFGLSWQIVPKKLGELLTDPDKEKADRALRAMMEMKKIDIAALQRAFDGK